MTDIITAGGKSPCSALMNATVTLGAGNTSMLGTAPFTTVYPTLTTSPVLAGQTFSYAGAGYLAGTAPLGLALVEGVATVGVTINVYQNKVFVASTVSASDGSWTVSNLNPTLTYDVVAVYPTYDNLIHANITPSLATLVITGTFPNAAMNRTFLARLLITGGSGVYSNPRVSSGSLPTGLTISICGTAGNAYLQVAGCPTVATSATLTFAVDSSDSQTATVTQTFKTQGFYKNIMGGSDVGMAFDLNDLSLLYTDTGATTNATAAGQTIKAMKCGLTGVVLTNSTGVALAKDTLSGRYYLSFTASNSAFTNSTGLPSAFLGNPNASLASACAPTATGTQIVSTFGLGGGNSGLFIGNQTSGPNYSFGIFGGGQATLSTPTTGPQVMVGTKLVNQLSAYKDGTLTNTVAVSADVIAGSNVVVGDSVNTGSPFGGAMYYVFLINRVLTSAEIAYLSSIG